MPYRIFKPRKKHRSHASSLIALSFSNVLVLAILLLSHLPVNDQGKKVLGFATNVTLVDLFDQTNLERQKLNLGKLKYSPVLEKIAKKKAKDMFADNYWAHIAPDGKTPWNFFEDEGYQYLYAGENLAKDFDKTDGLMKAWMNSPTHRENIVNPNYTEIGFAVENGTLDGEKTTLVVQMLAKPAPGYLSFSLARPEGEVSVNPVTVENNTKSLTLGKKSNSFVSIDISYVLYFAYFVLGFFAMSLIVDGVWAYKSGHLRLTGNTFSHILLFGASIIFVYYLHHPGII